jgi:hypothetical protein
MNERPNEHPRVEQGVTDALGSHNVTVEGEDLTRKPRKVAHLYPQYFPRQDAAQPAEPTDDGEPSA